MAVQKKASDGAVGRPVKVGATITRPSVGLPSGGAETTGQTDLGETAAPSDSSDEKLLSEGERQTHQAFEHQDPR